MRLNDQTTWWLASRSPRRLGLLREAGIDVQVQPSDIDDGQLRNGGVSAEAWVMAMAYLKARRVRDLLLSRPGADGPPAERRRLILAADTVCEHRGVMHGQPKDADHARGMVLAMRNDAHRTLTGVCLLDMHSSLRLITCDVATVQLGDVCDDAIDRYVESGQWQGKAGAYNYFDRLEDGWPLSCDGDPTTVMGLPMQRLPRMIDRFLLLFETVPPQQQTHRIDGRTM